jgi:uncharacterized oligopeptide transporter (OPT) family protein
VVFGVAIGALMTAAFVYIALKLGFTMPGSTVAAILGFAVLRGILRRGSIIENNLNQTIASGVNNASAGIAFTLPALFIIGPANPQLAGFDPTAALLAAALHLPAYYGLIPDQLTLGARAGLPSWLPVSLGTSFASIGAGLLAGRGGLPFVLGGMLAWWVLSPLATNLGWVPGAETAGSRSATCCTRRCCARWGSAS